MFRNVVKGRSRYTEYSLLPSSRPVTMGKPSPDNVAVAESSVDLEESQEIKSKGGWSDRFWGTSELDVKERKYVRKVDLYLL
jgi:hypothetical protein